MKNVTENLFVHNEHWGFGFMVMDNLVDDLMKFHKCQNKFFHYFSPLQVHQTNYN